MGNDWDWRDYTTKTPNKLRWWAVLFIVAVMIGAALKYGPSETRQTPQEQPKQTVTSASQSTGVPTPRPKREPHNPTSSSLRIYVVADNVSSYWGLQAVLDGWKLAKYTDFKLVMQCPTAPCITIKMAKLPSDTAAVAKYYESYTDLTIELNPIVKDHREAQSSLAHEFGHMLGAPHIVGTANSVMQPIGVYRILPTALDIQTVDRLGNWQLEKMYENSKKTVDARALPK